MTGFGFAPDCAITGIKKEINIKSECCALAIFLFRSVGDRTTVFCSKVSIYVNITFT